VSRRLALAWGVHSVYFDDQINDVPQMVVDACAIAAREGYATGGKYLAIAAGMPFGVVGSTNFIHIAKA
jgi:pyruvate kinase